RSLKLVFERHGFALTASSASDLVLDAAAADWDVLFAVDPLHEALNGDSAALAQPWQGMRGFAFYCRTEDGRPCP
ncbi:MAG TPA: hypothetical protein VGE07_05670, partial [Herpetosiphonaceae bacterium]